MTAQTRRKVGLLDMARGVARLVPDVPVLVKGAPGLLMRKPTDADSIGLVVQRLAASQPDHPFLKFEDQTLSYAEANARINQYAHVMTDQGVQRGDVVGLLATNELDTLLVTLATVKLGAVAGLLNHHQRSDVLAHSLGILSSRLVIVADDCTDALDTAGTAAAQQPALTFSQLRELAQDRSTENPAVTAEITGKERAFYIFTSGTTGLPKASIMSHFRWLKSYSGLGSLGMRLRPEDTMYCCLPLYHNNAVTVSLSSALAGGATYAIGRKFSASGFWDEVRRYDATSFVYIGELCRYLLAQPAAASDRDHRVRVIIGNGLRPEIWKAFQQRFGINRIAEFYGASECNIAFVNAFGLDETAGTCPLPHKVVAYDTETGAPLRDADNRLTAVRTGEVGLLLAKVTDRAPFDGYTDDAATERKLVRDGFKDGDCWFDTGDLVRKQGFQHVAFVDRLGDTFRWKGENVATTEVEAAVAALPEVEDVAVYGVVVPGADGKAGMASIVLSEGASFDAVEAGRRISAALPVYARPLFVRIVPSLEHTSTFKSRKVSLRDQGYQAEDPVYVLHGGDEGYVRYYEEYPVKVAGGALPH
ncbi:long-chain-acyl-CoA synthetase [Dermacoccaceae bacterium W4C1]